MSYEIRREDARAVMVVDGDMVASVVPELRLALRELVRSGSRDLVVDLAGTTMIDSMGLGLLLSAFNSLREKEGVFAVVNASQEILELLRSLRMHQHFPVSGK